MNYRISFPKLRTSSQSAFCKICSKHNQLVAIIMQQIIPASVQRVSFYIVTKLGFFSFFFSPYLSIGKTIYQSVDRSISLCMYTQINVYFLLCMYFLKNSLLIINSNWIHKMSSRKLLYSVLSKSFQKRNKYYERERFPKDC